MKRQFSAMFVAAAVLGVTTAFGANPFSDVTPDSWAYQSVSQLASAGIINGYPDGTFKGQKEITRFEMAQMIAKAMANQDRANAEQQAMINRLADEFSDELHNLGVRVDRLEERVGNVKITGDMRFRYIKSVNDIIPSPTIGHGGVQSRYKFDSRARILFNGKVNDRTDAVVRLTTGNFELGETYNPHSMFGFGEDPTTVKFDRAYVNHKFGKHVSVKAGRFGQMLGNGLSFDGEFDGLQFNAGNEKVQLQAAYGYMVSGEFRYMATDINPELVVLNLNGKVGKHLDLGGFYTRFNGEDYEINEPVKGLYGFNANVNVNKVWVGGEWLKASNIEESTAWTAGIGYGNYDIAKQGTWGVKVQHFNMKNNALIIDTTWNQPYGAGFKGWMATVDYALKNRVGLSAYYGFDWKYQDCGCEPNFYRVDLNYEF